MTNDSMLVVLGGAVITSLAGCVAFLFALFQKGPHGKQVRINEGNFGTRVRLDIGLRL